MNRQTNIKRKYASLRNAGFSAEEARKYKFWSDDRILKDLGVKTNKTVVKIRKKPTDPKKLKRYNSRKKREREKVIYAVSIGLKTKKVNKAKKYAKKKITSTKDYQTRIRQTEKRKITAKETQKRIELWEDWSKAENLPPEIHAKAKEVNRNTYTGEVYRNGKLIKKGHRLDETDKYGYMVAYYEFILNMDREDVIDQNPVDRFSGNNYTDVLAELL